MSQLQKGNRKYAENPRVYHILNTQCIAGE